MTPESSRRIILLGFFLVVLALVIQQRTLHSLQTELAAVRPAPNQSVVQVRDEPSGQRPPSGTAEAPLSDGSPAALDQRLVRLEEAVSRLSASSDVLMERGVLPLSGDKVRELSRKFLDGSLPDDERVQALKLLQRNRAVDGRIVAGAVAWMNSTTNAGLVDSLLYQLRGVTDPVLRDPLLRIAATSTHAGVRRQAVGDLLSFAADPSVEAALWSLLSTDPSSEVRNQAAEVLRRSPVSDTRLADLRQRTLDTGASFDERLTAFQAMSSSKQADAQMTAAFADSVVDAQDRGQMARLFAALDNTGNLAAAPALVKGLQTGDPELRGLALDALSEMQDDPTVKQWLTYVAGNDPDQRVRAAAERVLAQGSGKKP